MTKKYDTVYNRLYNLKEPSLFCSYSKAGYIGLPTADELVLAGVRVNTINSKYFLGGGNSFWTMSGGVPIISKNLEMIEKNTNYKSNEKINAFLKEKHEIRSVITIKKDIYVLEGTGYYSNK